ncbi:deleted in malignant brain tumors 1 protein-like [Lytechinus pictus]|uniref:deleted in malignant brain tumors 1 protein-like n=1 Tax=Lytechinus pictus TaxID=7653 RepID=UPI0030B9C76A
MLGFDGALDAPVSDRFGQGSGSILLDQVGCDGTEDSLLDCVHAGTGPHSCTQRTGAGAVCYSGAFPEPFQIRLVDGSSGTEGRVEVMYGGSWGTVCDDEWDLNDARVICRMLGFDGALNAPGSATFGQGSGDILLDSIGCTGTEDNLAECIHKGIGDHDCAHTEDAGAVCYSGIHPHTFNARLVNGMSRMGITEGRVEVLYEGSWRTICDRGWDLRVASVVCRMLGFDGTLDAPGSAKFGQGSGPILRKDLHCAGTEHNLADCPIAVIEHSECNHQRDSGAICYSGGVLDPFEVRLVGGSNEGEGTVDVMYGGSWGTICDRGWDLRDASVVCRMLGFDGALDAPGSAKFGQGWGEVFLDNVGCIGTEDSLANCLHRGIGVTECGYEEVASVVCFSGSPFKIRLVDGSNDAEGRVEILYNGTWGTICDTWWDLRDARVACRMMGFLDASVSPIFPRFGQGDGHGLLTGVGCIGTEDSLADCFHRGVGSYPCSGDAGASCSKGVRLLNGLNESQGRVEVLHEGFWGSVCDDSWDLDDATVVCRQLGFDEALAALPNAKFGEGSGEIFLDEVRCNGTETNIKNCKHKGIRVHNCIHKEDASVICRQAGTSNKMTPRTDISMSEKTSHAVKLTSPENIFTKVTHPFQKSKPEISTSTKGSFLPGLIGSFISFLSIVLIASLAYCIRRFKMSMARRTLNDHGYVDVTNITSFNVLSTNSAPQGSSYAPPPLPDRPNTNTLGRHKMALEDMKGGETEEVNEQAWRDPPYQTPRTDKDFDKDGHLLADASRPSVYGTTTSDKEGCDVTDDLAKSFRNKEEINTLPLYGNEDVVKHEYMDLKTASKKSKTEDVDLNGYLLPSKSYFVRECDAAAEGQSEGVSNTGIPRTIDGKKLASTHETTRGYENFSPKPAIENGTDLDGPSS